MILTTTYPNNSVLLKYKSISVINEFYSDDNSIIYAKITKFTQKKSIYSYPCDLSSLNIFQVSNLSNDSDCTIGQDSYIVQENFILLPAYKQT